jgi:hypothetical protein
VVRDGDAGPKADDERYAGDGCATRAGALTDGHEEELLREKGRPSRPPLNETAAVSDDDQPCCRVV